MRFHDTLFLLWSAVVRVETDLSRRGLPPRLILTVHTQPLIQNDNLIMQIIGFYFLIVQIPNNGVYVDFIKNIRSQILKTQKSLSVSYFLILPSKMLKLLVGHLPEREVLQPCCYLPCS